MFKLIRNSNLICRLVDGAIIPDDERNADRQAYLAWVAKGNNPLPADPAPLPTQDELDTEAARADEKLATFAAATPAQIRTWANNNFPSLTAAERDKLGTAFVALCVLVRRI